MCYKIIIDPNFCQNISSMFDLLSKIGDVIYPENGVFYVFLNKQRNKKYIANKIKSIGITEFIVSEITLENVSDKMNFTNVWICEHFEKCQIEKIEQTKQKELKEIRNSIVR